MSRWYVKWIGMGVLASMPSVSMAKFVQDAQTIDSTLDSYLGLALKYNWVKPTSDWSRIIQKNHPGFDIYFGGYVNDCWSVDIGYDWTNRKPKSTAFTSGDRLLGVTNTGGVVPSVTGQIRLKSGHLDINYFLPSKQKPMSLILSVGVALTKPSLNLSWQRGVLTAADNNFAVEGRRKAYMRLGLGLQSMLTEIIGVRAMYRFEYTSQIRGRFGAAELPEYRQILRNGHSLSLGVLFKI